MCVLLNYVPVPVFSCMYSMCTGGTITQISTGLEVLVYADHLSFCMFLFILLYVYLIVYHILAAFLYVCLCTSG